MRVPRLFAVLVLVSVPLFGFAQGTSRAFVGARIVDGTGSGPIENGVLVVRSGRVEAVGPTGAVRIPADAERVDVAGMTIVPGFINSHGHAGAQADEKLGLYARYGVTTVVSLGGENRTHAALRDAQDTSNLARTRIFIAGPVLGPRSSLQAAEQVDDLAREMAVDWIKIRVDPGMGGMPEDVYAAVIDNAHRHGLPLAAHMYTLEDAKGLVRRGADLLAHSVRDREVDEELVSMLRERGGCLSPTLVREVSTFIYESTPEFFSDPFFLAEADPGVIESLRDPGQQRRMAARAQTGKDALAMAQRNLKILSDGGVRIAFGTDSGASPSRFPGYFEHVEMELMSRAGLTPMQILVSATGDAAECMGLDSLGTLTPGRWADFSVLGANPLDDIRNTRTIESVWIAGNRVPRAEIQGSASR